YGCLSGRIPHYLGMSMINNIPVCKPINLRRRSMTADSLAISTSPAVIDRRYSAETSRALARVCKVLLELFPELLELVSKILHLLPQLFSYLFKFGDAFAVGLSANHRRVR